MIRIMMLPNKDIDCIFEGTNDILFVEFNSATVGMIKKLREKGDSDKDIRDLLLGNIDIAFKIADSKTGIKEINNG